MRRFAVFVIAVLLTGCMVGPNYRRPVVDTPQSFRYEEKDARDTANTEWWKQFEDPVLVALIAEALANNKTVKIAAANIEQAAGVLMQTRAPLFPQVGYSGSATRERLSQLTATPLPSTVPNPAVLLPVARRRQLGDRPLGPHPAANRGRTGEPVRHR